MLNGVPIFLISGAVSQLDDSTHFRSGAVLLLNLNEGSANALLT